MNSFRKWLFRPKKTDTSLLAQFYHADDELNLIAAELDSFDGRKDPERCTMLVNQLRVCQDRVLNVIQKVMEDVIPGQRANRDFRVKFPDDVLQDSLAGQLWFGAECLAAGSSILNREVESASMRPLARALTKNLDSLRVLLRDQCLRSSTEYNDRIKEALVIFDKLFAEFELSYVSAMVPVKTMKEYDMLQEVTVLFSETVQRALKEGLLSQDMIDYCDPALMFTIPRLAIVCGLLIYPEGPLNPDMEPTNMTEMYRPFLTLLHKIRELLYTLSESELALLEKALCSSEEPEVATHRSMASQSDLSVVSQLESPLQVDQGFHEGGEGNVQVDTFRSSILVPIAGSPVTPVNLNSNMHYLDLSPMSPTTTLVEDLSQSEIDENCLNKSESQDSGLHSENISTSDTVILDCPPLISHEVETQSHSTLIASDKSTQIDDQSIVKGETDILCSQMSDITHCDNAEDCDRLSGTCCCYSHSVENVSEVWHLCREIIEEVVMSAVHSGTGPDNLTFVNEAQASLGNSDAIVTSLTGLTNNSCPIEDHLTEVVDGVSGKSEMLRQFSWHYNVQFACPQLPLSQRDRERNSSGSFSSESTISDSEFNNESVTDFVVETLANINNPANYSDKSTSTKPNAHIGAPHVSEQNTCAKSSDFTNSGYKLCSSNTKLPADQSTMSYTNDCLLPQTSLLTSNVPNTAEKLKKLKKVKHERVQNIMCRVGNHMESSNSCNRETDCTVQGTTSHQAEEDFMSSSSSSCPSSDSECGTNYSCAGSETSSYNSENNDVEEIALAIEAAETASRNEARARFRSSSDLIHRLFVCVAGVADQLQTNYASDLRHILKCVFELNASVTDQSEDKTRSNILDIVSDLEQEVQNQQLSNNQPSHSDQSVASNRMTNEQINPQISRNRTSTSSSSRSISNEPPEWVPDDEVEICTACRIPFTFVRRRHHCRNCGKIFCAKCSSTTVPLPQYGHQKPVRVCHRCFIYQISHFTVTRDF